MPILGLQTGDMRQGKWVDSAKMADGRKRFLNKLKLAGHMYSLIAWSLLIFFGQALAQEVVPTAQQMVEQLASPAKPQRTRSFRNLTIEAVPVYPDNDAGTLAAPSDPLADNGPQLAVARPSLSLNIQFDFNSFRIRPDSQVVLHNLAVALASPELLAFPFLIEGHTDARGAADFNRTLSAQRAQAVKDLLVAKGIDGVRLQSVGKGSSELANPAVPLAAVNRRVKILNLD